MKVALPCLTLTVASLLGTSASAANVGNKQCVKKKTRQSKNQKFRNALHSPWRNAAADLQLRNNHPSKGDFSSANFLTPPLLYGSTLLTAHPLERNVMLGTNVIGSISNTLQLNLYSLDDKLRRWMEVEELLVEAKDSYYTEFTTYMGRNTIAVHQRHANATWYPTGSEVQLYRYYGFGNMMMLMEMGPPLQMHEEGMAVSSMAMADEVTLFNEPMQDAELIVAQTVGPMDLTTSNQPATIRIQTLTTTFPNNGASDDDELPILEWKMIQSIQGNNALFGLDIQLSHDGTVLAVVGSYDVPKSSDDDDDWTNLSCFIRVIQYQDDSYVQMGDDIKIPRNKYQELCDPVNLSGDGSTILTGHRAYKKDCHAAPVPNGHLTAYQWHDNKQWKRKGADLDATFPIASSPNDFLFGAMGHVLNYDGSRAVVAAYEQLPLNRADDVYKAYYLVTLEFDDKNWTQVASSTLPTAWNSQIAMSHDVMVVETPMSTMPGSSILHTYKYEDGAAILSTK